MTRNLLLSLAMLTTGCLPSIEAGLARDEAQREEYCFSAFDLGRRPSDCMRLWPRYKRVKAERAERQAQERREEEERQERNRRLEALADAQRAAGEAAEEAARERYKDDPAGYCIWQASAAYVRCAEEVRSAQRVAEGGARTVYQQQVIATKAQTETQNCAALQAAELARCQTLQRRGQDRSADPAAH
ncbi:MAG: hypothetical protein M3Q75_09385 [Gemmatimonadota bacterium]|nr:hypothetical protein [Gemmatimonadota bacterium]